ncbi:MAG TPA: hypothetical protein VLF67_01805, partial [Candidatus Saccharimonas sp.]|nr:hypothetical protein [Candidatus Saccharimonas sp.]
QIDPHRAELQDLLSELQDRAALLRDYASTPGNTWLAKGELQRITQLVSDLEATLEAIAQNDAENGF